MRNTAMMAITIQATMMGDLAIKESRAQAIAMQPIAINNIMLTPRYSSPTMQNSTINPAVHLLINAATDHLFFAAMKESMTNAAMALLINAAIELSFFAPIETCRPSRGRTSGCRTSR